MTCGIRCRGCVVGAAAEFGARHKGCSGRGPTLMLFDSVVVIVQQGFDGTGIEGQDIAMGSGLFPDMSN